MFPLTVGDFPYSHKKDRLCRFVHELIKELVTKVRELSSLLKKTILSQTNFEKKFKNYQFKLYLKQFDNEIINEFIDTSRYVYNKTLEYFKKRHSYILIILDKMSL